MVLEKSSKNAQEKEETRVNRTKFKECGKKTFVLLGYLSLTCFNCVVEAL